jgi:hypothetical protein
MKKRLGGEIIGYDENGIPTVTAIRKGSQFVFDCPFCGHRHSHGAIEGHRVAHCWLDPSSRKFHQYTDAVKKIEGKGYFLKEVRDLPKKSTEIIERVGR